MTKPKITRFDRSGQKSEHGELMLYVEYSVALQEAYLRGIKDGFLAAQKNREPGITGAEPIIGYVNF